MLKIKIFHIRKNDRLIGIISMITLIAYVNLVIGCSYYKVNNLDPLSNESIINQVQQKGKYVVLHYGEKAWHLKNVVLNDTEKELKGILEQLPSNHKYYIIAKGEKKANRYKNVKKQDRPIYEVHIYTSQDPETASAETTIPLSSMNKVEVYDQHVGATVLSVVGTVVVMTGLLAVIIAATKSSCPFVYTDDGDGFRFVGEMYGGAIYSSLERDDYMPLPGFLPVNGEYNLRIANELLERQYTNLANLMVVEHSRNAQVILDKDGNVHTTALPQSPEVTSYHDHTSLVLKNDGSSYLFNDPANNSEDVRSLELSFKRPDNINTGKLILNAKNSFWLDYAYGKFNERFGIYFNSFVEKQRTIPAAKHNQWSLEQNIPLSVYVKTGSGWRFVDYFNSVGPMASRDLVMPIDLKGIQGGNITIKLECGFMFWEVDYAAMDFSINNLVKIHSITASTAVDEKGTNVSPLIAATDDKYLIQPEIGNVVNIKYQIVPPTAGNTQTAFLHSRGYYEYIRDYKNIPDIVELKSFKNKGAFTRFAKKQYNEFISTEGLFAAALTQNNGN